MAWHLLGTFALILIACNSCATCDRGVPSAAPLTFSEQEIRSKVWKDPNGVPMELLDWCVMSFTSDEQLLMAKFGNPRTGFVKCLEFYRVTHTGTGPVAVSS